MCMHWRGCRHVALDMQRTLPDFKNLLLTLTDGESSVAVRRFVVFYHCGPDVPYTTVDSCPNSKLCFDQSGLVLVLHEMYWNMKYHTVN